MFKQVMYSQNTFNAGVKLEEVRIRRRPYQFYTKMIWDTTLCTQQNI